jgi:hypothetical protein
MRVVPGWSQHFMKTLRGTYGKFPGWEEHELGLVHTLANIDDDDTTVSDVGYEIAFWLKEALGLEYNLHRSLGLVPERPGDATAWMASFSYPLKASDYVQGATSIAAYFKKGNFKPAGVRLWGQEYKCPVDGMVSILDPLLRYGTAYTKDLIGADKGFGIRANTVVRLEQYE